MLNPVENPILSIGIAVCILALVYSQRRTTPKLPDLPWVNREQGWFSKWRARINTSLNYRASVLHAYTQYSKVSQSCILPSLSRDVILLPLESINWIAHQPDSELNFVDVAKYQLQLDHTFLVPQVTDNPSHHDTIRIDLTRQLGSLTSDLLDELDASFTDLWGTDTEKWNDVCVYETLIKIVARTSNRVFVGKPLCRDEKLLNSAMGFAQTLPVASTVLRCLPALLRPLLAPAIAYLAHKREKEFTKLVTPVILAWQQQDAIQQSEKSKNFLQWTIDRASASGVPSESEARIIAARLLIVNFAAIHTSTFSITNAIFDLLASNESNVSFLRQEAEAALAATNGVWSKATVQRLNKHDSALRESSRLGTLSGIGLTRLVTNPEGLQAPDGTHCPQGSWVAVAVKPIHHDPENYSDVADYKPFRFSEMKEATNGLGVEKHQITEDLIKKANLSFVTTSDKFMTFGHGRHACPGRFFAANELKLLLSYMVLHYDFQILDDRPPSTWIGDLTLPPMKATVRVRRRKAESA